MPTHVETLLTTLGLPAEDVTKITTLPEAEQATFDAKPYVEKVAANYRTQNQNDPAFFSDITLDKLPPEIKKKVESAQFLRASTIVRDKLIKGLGLTETEYADLSDDEKEKLESFVPAITSRYIKKGSTGDKQLQADLIEARKKIEAFDGYEDKVKTKYETESNQKITAAIFNSALVGELSAIPGLKIAAGDIAKTANDILTSKYGFERTGDYTVELRQKSNPTMKVLKPNSSQELTLREALLEIATERGWVEAKPAGVSGSGKVTVTPNGKGGLEMIPPHLRDKISKKIAEEQ